MAARPPRTTAREPTGDDWRRLILAAHLGKPLNVTLYHNPHFSDGVWGFHVCLYGQSTIQAAILKTFVGGDFPDVVCHHGDRESAVRWLRSHGVPALRIGTLCADDDQFVVLAPLPEETEHVEPITVGQLARDTAATIAGAIDATESKG